MFLAISQYTRSKQIKEILKLWTSLAWCFLNAIWTVILNAWEAHFWTDFGSKSAPKTIKNELLTRSIFENNFWSDFEAILEPIGGAIRRPSLARAANQRTYVPPLNSKRSLTTSRLAFRNPPTLRRPRSKPENLRAAPKLRVELDCVKACFP